MGQEQEILEETFRLIQQGNEHVETKEHWKAADCFAQAQANLAQLVARTDQQHQPERQKIAQLYHQQAVEYLKKGRQALLQALEQEMINDEPHVLASLPPTVVVTGEAATTVAEEDSCSSGATQMPSRLLHDLSEHDAAHRLNVFGRLFAKELHAVQAPLDNNNNKNAKSVEEQESHLAARLMQLTQSLPTSFQTEQEKMRNLNRGLARLGLEPVGDASQRTGRPRSWFGLVDHAIVDANHKTELEQVAEIMAQAKDEVALNEHIAGGGDGGTILNNDTALAEAAAAGRLAEAAALLDSTNVAVADDENGYDSAAEDDDLVSNDDQDEDAELTPELCRDLHNRLAAAQASLSELVALFEADTAGDAAIEFEQARGKTILRETRLLLHQVAKKWSEC